MKTFEKKGRKKKKKHSLEARMLSRKSNKFKLNKIISIIKFVSPN